MPKRHKSLSRGVTFFYLADTDTDTSTGTRVEYCDYSWTVYVNTSILDALLDVLYYTVLVPVIVF